MEYDAILYIYYDVEANLFYDDGWDFFNIYEVVTPNDIYLFKHDPGFRTFPHRSDRSILCEIVKE